MSGNNKTVLQDKLKEIHDTDYDGDEGTVMKAIMNVLMREFEVREVADR
jgi:hypothetical protein